MRLRGNNPLVRIIASFAIIAWIGIAANAQPFFAPHDSASDEVADFALVINEPRFPAGVYYSQTSTMAERAGLDRIDTVELVGRTGTRSIFRQKARGIGRVDLMFELRSGVQTNFGVVTCTGFLISTRHVLTARHCLSGKGFAPGDLRAARIVLDYLDDGRSAGMSLPLNVGTGRVQVGIPETRGSDFAFLEVSAPALVPPERVLTLAPYEEVLNDNIFLIHHPFGRPLHLSQVGCLAFPSEIEGTASHTCKTYPGSSGGPVFSRGTGGLVGMHVAASEDLDRARAFLIPSRTLARALEGLLSKSALITQPATAKWSDEATKQVPELSTGALVWPRHNEGSIYPNTSQSAHYEFINQDIDKRYGERVNYLYVSYLSPAATDREDLRAVGRVDFWRLDGSRASCTGFAVSTTHILTAGHCFFNDAGNWLGYTRAVLQLDLLHPEGAGLSLPLSIPQSEDEAGSCLDDEKACVNKDSWAIRYGGNQAGDLDFAVLPFAEGAWNLAAAHGIRPVPLADAPIVAQDELYLGHHALGLEQVITAGPKCQAKIDSEENIETRFRHACDTQLGSSGAPVFSRRYRAVVAMHVCCNLPSANDTVGWNSAIRASQMARYSKVIDRLIDRKPLTAEQQRYMLVLRRRATEAVERDPVLAFRFAQAAFQLKDDAETRRLVRQSISTIDLLYDKRFDGFSVADVSGDLVLLRGEGQGQYMVWNARTSEHHRLLLDAPRAWIIPLTEGWRVLAQTWEGEGMEARPILHLVAMDGTQVNQPIEVKNFSIPHLIRPAQALIEPQGLAATAIWDLRSGILKRLDDSGGPHEGVEYRYDTTSTGDVAVGTLKGLMLERLGRLMPDTLTAVQFDASTLFTRAAWSADGKFLALNYFENFRLGIWNLVGRSFDWLDPQHWLADSYAWSNGGHLLAFAGRTEKPPQITTLELIDAAQPLASRIVLNRAGPRIFDVVFLPGDERLAVADDSDTVRVLGRRPSEMFGAGRHVGANVARTAAGSLITGSRRDVRRWPLVRAPATRWRFASSEGRQYVQAAADKAWQNLAVAYISAAAKDLRIEIRNVSTGETTDLNAPDDLPHDLVFSHDSRWLVITTSHHLRIYNTLNWRPFDFSLIGDDKQFLSTEADNGSIRAQTLGKDDLVADNEHEYLISLEGDTPTFVERRLAAKSDDSPDRVPRESVDGWSLLQSAEYLKAGITVIDGAGWNVQQACRGSAFYGEDCDFQFIPSDIERLITMYDSLVWRPSATQLEALSLYNSTEPVKVLGAGPAANPK